MIKYLNPEGLHKHPAYSQVVITEGPGRTIYIGGQNGINANGEIVGKGDIARQTEQTLKNIDIALASCNASFANLMKLTIYIVQGQDLNKAFQASQPFFSKISNQPIITVLVVAGLANPDYLVEIEATAFVPAE
jgi:enamine deaminase RidA (YjgF/YER057c/UK114 family)